MVSSDLIEFLPIFSTLAKPNYYYKTKQIFICKTTKATAKTMPQASTLPFTKERWMPTPTTSPHKGSIWVHKHQTSHTQTNSRMEAISVSSHSVQWRIRRLNILLTHKKCQIQACLLYSKPLHKALCITVSTIVWHKTLSRVWIAPTTQTKELSSINQIKEKCLQILDLRWREINSTLKSSSHKLFKTALPFQSNQLTRVVAYRVPSWTLSPRTLIKAPHKQPWTSIRALLLLNLPHKSSRECLTKTPSTSNLSSLFQDKRTVKILTIPRDSQPAFQLTLKKSLRWANKSRRLMKALHPSKPIKWDDQLVRIG